MRRMDVLRLAAVATFALSTALAGAVPVQAAGLSDKQKDEISEFVKCQTYLLKGDLASFQADSDCGHGPGATDLKSLGSQKGEGGSSSCPAYEGGDFKGFGLIGRDDDGCYPPPPPCEDPEYPDIDS